MTSTASPEACRENTPKWRRNKRIKWEASWNPVACAASLTDALNEAGENVERHRQLTCHGHLFDLGG